jgi:hypothetical protein
MDENQIAQLEQLMAESVQKEAPEDVQEFVDSIMEGGITQQEVDEVRQQTVMALQDQEYFQTFIRYLTGAGLLEQEDAPSSYDVGFVLSILGLVGVAQSLVTTR